MTTPDQPRLRPHGPDDIEVAESRSAGWVFRCHRCDITKANLKEEVARSMAEGHAAPPEPAWTPETLLPDEDGTATIEALRDELETAQLLLAQAEQYARDLQDGTHPGLEALLDGVRAEGRRQATEGWDREAGVRYPGGKVWRVPPGVSAEAKVAKFGGRVISRLVGPWEPAEVVEP